jgi:hypothetical protein
VTCDIPSIAFDKGYNFALDLISIGLHTKLWGPKVTRFPTLGILRLPFGSPGLKCHLDVGLVKGTKYNIKGKVGKVLASLKFGL